MLKWNKHECWIKTAYKTKAYSDLCLHTLNGKKKVSGEFYCLNEASEHLIGLIKLIFLFVHNGNSIRDYRRMRRRLVAFCRLCAQRTKTHCKRDTWPENAHTHTHTQCGCLRVYTCKKANIRMAAIKVPMLLLFFIRNFLLSFVFAAVFWKCQPSKQAPSPSPVSNLTAYFCSFLRIYHHQPILPTSYWVTRPRGTWVVLVFTDFELDQFLTLLQDLDSIFHWTIVQADVVDGQKLVTQLQSSRPEQEDGNIDLSELYIMLKNLIYTRIFYYLGKFPPTSVFTGVE